MTKAKNTKAGHSFLDTLRQLDPRPKIQREMEREGRVFVNRREATPILDDLAKVGFKVNWISELRALDNYEAAIPILTGWISKTQNADLRADIFRALSVPWAKATVVPFLLTQFRLVEDPTGVEREAIGSALSNVVDDTMFDEIKPLVEDKKFGKGRALLILSLGKFKDPRAIEVLISLLDDEDVRTFAVTALGALKATSARSRLEEFSQTQDPVLRREAAAALAKISRNPR